MAALTSVALAWRASHAAPAPPGDLDAQLVSALVASLQTGAGRHESGRK